VLEDDSPEMDAKYKALVEALKLLGSESETVDVLVDCRDDLTEVTLILPGEYQ
jgi:hypothetical protein